MGILTKMRGVLQREQKYELVKETAQEHFSLHKSLLVTTQANPLAWLCLNLGLFCFSILALVGAVFHNAGDAPSGTNSVLVQTSAFSPIFSRLEIPLITKKMNATLVPSPADEIFRRDPSPEVDAAWRRISNEQPIAITRAEVLAMGKDPSQAVRWPESSLGLNGEGDDDKFVGRIDVFHQIHCLDALRREAHFEHYYGDKYPGGLNSTTPLHRAHLSHCVYYLLQNIMCQASVDVYTHVWTDTLLQPFPDFQIEHKCRSFDAILDWQERSSMDLHDLYALRKPESYGPAIEMSAEFKDLWREFDFYNADGEHHHSGGGHIG